MKNEARRLYELGFAVHWLEPKSKAPVKGGWSGPTRDSWEALGRDYREGRGLGVRLGAPSKLENGYLCVVDIDLKSGDQRHTAEAFACVEKRFPGLMESAPSVTTGRGLHLYARTLKPVKSGKIRTSNETVKVYSPTSPMNKKQAAKLTPVEIRKGLRIKNAWEVEFMSAGKQVVLPPTLHPDTGAAYKWLRPLGLVDDLPWINTGVEGVASDKTKASIEDFAAVGVDLVTSNLSDRIVAMILTGDEVEDRSNACFSVTLAMLKSEFTDQEIMSVLTDRSTFLGETAFDHRKTTSRAYAAAWVHDYCIVKAREQLRADRAFSEEVSVTPLLDESGAATQTVELVEIGDWQNRIIKSGKDEKGPPKSTLKNVILILKNAVSDQIFIRNLFALRDYYGIDTPWGAKENDLIDDDGILLIKFWLANHFGFEPSKNLIEEAVTIMSIENGFHPVREAYAVLPEWDGVERLDTWLARNFEAEGHPEYLAQVFRKWMVAAVTRIYEPGHKFDWMIIFEGAQGVGKSSFGRLLFGDEYFTDWLPELSNKDAALALQGRQCVEFGELASLRKSEIDTIKAFMTRTIDKVRPPYGRRLVESHRQCVFFGTTNRDEYLRDDTGNRRFNPVKVGKLDFAALARDREQLFAEAIFIYQNKLESELWLTDDALVFSKEIQEEKMISDESDLMIEEIQKIEASPESIIGKLNPNGVKISDLFGEQGHLNRWKKDAKNMMLAAKTLKNLGYERQHTRKGKIWVKNKSPILV